MVRTDFLQDERVQWLRYVLNSNAEMPPVKDWAALLAFAEKQSVSGICLPEDVPVNLPKPVLLQWIGQVQLIEQQNKLINRRIEQLFEMLEHDGFRCCLLKGQGNAMMYPIPIARCSGDIDVWLDADEETVYQYVKKKYPDEIESHKHIHFPIFDDAPVDMHYTPLKIYHPAHNRKLQRWILENKEKQMRHLVRLPDTGREIAVPTVDFNAVYQLGHIMIHIEAEGIGLRQLVDFFYVLQELKGASEERKNQIIMMWKQLGMYKLARAVMWVEKEMLGLPEEYLLVEPDEKKGSLLAEDILEGGNFGHSSDREKYRKHGKVAKKFSDLWHLVKLSICFPGDAFFRIVMKIKTFVTKY